MTQHRCQSVLPFPLYRVLHLPSNGKFFVPSILNISAGTTVTWTNGDLTSYKSFEVEQLHTVTSGSLESGNIGRNLIQVFLPRKTFHLLLLRTLIISVIHPFMTGKVIVS